MRSTASMAGVASWTAQLADSTSSLPRSVASMMRFLFFRTLLMLLFATTAAAAAAAAAGRPVHGRKRRARKETLQALQEACAGPMVARQQEHDAGSARGMRHQWVCVGWNRHST